MISSAIIRGYIDIMILSILKKNNSYGYEISKQIKTISEEKYIIKETTLYSAFTRLEKSGYISSYYGTETNGKRRTYYEITANGSTYFSDKCTEWELVKDVVNKFVRTA